MRRRRPVKKLVDNRRSLLLAVLAGGGIGGLALLLGVVLGAPRPPAYLSGNARRAAIVDQIALTFPNPEFIDKARDTLRRAGYEVDTYSADEVTVELYRSLPARGYQLVLVRSHATNLYNGAPGGPDALFTSQPYDKKQYAWEQLTDQMAAARVVYGDDPTRYFSIMANFVRQSMVGRFDRTLIILGGCQTLATGDLGQALLDKGASAVVGWNEMVTLPHNDQALLTLLHNAVLNAQPIDVAIQNTMAAVGPDPQYHSSLVVRTR